MAKGYGSQGRTRFNFQKRNISQFIKTNDGSRIIRPILQGDCHIRGISKDMRVGDNNARRFNDETGP